MVQGSTGVIQFTTVVFNGEDWKGRRQLGLTVPGSELETKNFWMRISANTQNSKFDVTL
jgi:hypothetical protein